jgi:plastocyanin
MLRHLAILTTVMFCATVFAGEGGTLKGSIQFDGDPPPIAKVKIDAAKKGECKHDAPNDEAWIVDPATKGLKWVIVRVMDVKLEPKDGKELPPVKIDQKDCVFLPYAVIVSPDQGVEVMNPEGIAHNFHTLPLDGSNIPYNRMCPPGQPSLKVPGRHFSTPEMINFTCDIHPWMKGHIAVHDPRFAAVTGADGTFEIKDVPPGQYKVIVSHNAVDQEKEIEIKAGQAAVLEGVKFKKK